jgi:hypothetical protein
MYNVVIRARSDGTRHNRGVRLQFTGRALVCIAPVPPSAVDFERFQHTLQLGEPRTQVRTDQLAVLDYRDLQLLATEGRLHADFRPSAARDLVRQATQETLEYVALYRPTGVGFNGNVRVDVEDGEDLFAGIVDEGRLAANLGQAPRVGLKLVYREDEATISLDFQPVVNEDRVWLVGVNRHYDSLPSDEARAAAVAWFAALNDELPRLVRQVLRREAADEHAA